MSAERSQVNAVLLSKLQADPDRYQYREGPYSDRTVAAIVAEGIDLAKFDPIPIINVKGTSRYCVAGDGHSRLEAVRRLAGQKRLPAAWRVRNDWNIPCRKVSADEAKRLAYTANLSRTNLTAAEEAAVFAAMLEDGIDLAGVAKIAQRSPAYITRSLSMNSLCHDIRVMVGMEAAAGGIDILTAQVLANGFKRHGIEPQQQQEIWHNVLKHAMLNFESAKKFIDSMGGRLGQRSDDGGAMLFALPANAAATIAQAKERGSVFRSAKMGLSLLMRAAEQGGLADYPELSAWLDRNGVQAVAALKVRATEDAAVLAAMVA